LSAARAVERISVSVSGNHDGSAAGAEGWREEIPHGIHEEAFCLVESNEMWMTMVDNIVERWLVCGQATAALNG
jgi:hypothetical protein